MARLIIYEEADASETIFETFDLSHNSILIGSDPDNHLILETETVDPSHASLELRDNTWVLQDLGGPGGTAVNNHVIEGPHRLFHDDLIELGSIKMRFQDPERGATKEFPHSKADEADDSEAEGVTAEDVHISGRVWFATVAAATSALIFIIIFLLVVAHFLGIINIGDLLPPWLGL